MATSQHRSAEDLRRLPQARVGFDEDPDRDRHQRHAVGEGGQDLRPPVAEALVRCRRPPASQAAKRATPSERLSESMCPASASSARLPVRRPPMISTTVKLAVRASTIASARRFPSRLAVCRVRDVPWNYSIAAVLIRSPRDHFRGVRPERAQPYREPASFPRKRNPVRQRSAPPTRSDLPRLLAERHFQLHLFSVAEDRQGDRVARLIVAQGAEEVPVALHSGVAQGRDDVPLAHPGLGGCATRHDLLHQRARVYGQVEPSGVLGAQIRRQRRRGRPSRPCPSRSAGPPRRPPCQKGWRSRGSPPRSRPEAGRRR